MSFHTTMGTIASSQAIEESFSLTAIHFPNSATSDHVWRTTDMIGQNDSKLLTISVWIKPENVAGNQYIIGNELAHPNGSEFVLYRTGQNIAMLGEVDPSVGVIDAIDFITTSAPLSYDTWNHILISCDMSDLGKRHVYVNDVAAAVTWNDYADYAINFANGTGISVGGRPGTVTSTQFNGCMTELWFGVNVYFDLGVETNRRKFVGDLNHPVDLGVDGSLPNGGAPFLYWKGNSANVYKNEGSGEDFTNGASLSACADIP